MRISILCSDEWHPVYRFLLSWVEKNQATHDIELVTGKQQLSGGDILFLVSCSEIIDKAIRSNYRTSLVVHASDLPRGRGWSPHIWQIVEGAEQITMSLLEAEDKVDSGRIWAKVPIVIPKDALWDEINTIVFEAELKLMDFAVENLSTIQPSAQDTAVEPTYYARRTPLDSRIDPSKSIAGQFDRIRVCDPGRYPAFFEFRGHKYKLTLEKIDDE